MAGISAKKINVADELIGNSLQERPEKIALYCGDEKITYRDLVKNVNKFANILRGFDIKPADRVMIMLPDSPLFVYAFLGSIKCGAWPVPVNTMLGVDDYCYLLSDSESKFLITGEDSNAARANVSHECTKVFPNDSLKELFATSSEKADPHLVNPDEIAFWLYSSGSTGKPKPTPHKQSSMLFTADTYAKHVIHLREDDICFSVSKLFFAYGLGNGLTFPLRFGASSVLLSDPPTPEKVIKTIVDYKPTVFFGVPTMYNSLLKKMNGEDTSSIRVCVSAGEALPPEIFKQWQAKTNCEIVDGIGSTEALHVFISNRPGNITEGSSGSLVPGYEARIVDDQGDEVRMGETGHLLIRGDSITPGYWNRPEQNSEKMLENGWFKTGDMYSQDDGHFIYQGRGDDMLKAGGIWVSPVEIEYALLEHEAVCECAVVGNDVEGLQKPFAYVVLNCNSDPMNGQNLETELLEFLSKKLPKFKRPWGINFMDELPKTATGKIQRFKLRNKRETMPNHIHNI